jgi:hypothetical protein
MRQLREMTYRLCYFETGLLAHSSESCVNARDFFAHIEMAWIATIPDDVVTGEQPIIATLREISYSSKATSTGHTQGPKSSPGLYRFITV